MPDLSAYSETAIAAARAAGDVLRDWGERFSVREKGPANLVTEADLAAQEAIVTHIRARFPDHGLLGEEGLDQPGRGEPFCWIIDPLDGTSNYVHSFPYYCVSIALASETKLLVGVVYDPNRDEMFVARDGQGAWRNGAAIRPSSVSTLDKAFVVASLPSAVGRNDPAVARLLRVLPAAQSVQRTGSAALNLSYVACGRMDAFWSTNLKAWDVAAGAVIIREAGGTITRLDGGPFDPFVPSLLVSNGSDIHGELVELLSAE